MARKALRTTGWGLLLLAGCEPSLNWREVTEPGVSLVAQFPCKPQRVTNPDLGLLQCEAGGLRFMVTWRRYAEPGVQQLDLAEQIARLTQRHGGKAQPMEGPMPKGAIAWSGSGRFALHGGTQPVWVQLWARGPYVYQALVLAQPGGPAQQLPVSEFFDGLRYEQ